MNGLKELPGGPWRTSTGQIRVPARPGASAKMAGQPLIRSLAAAI